jgi:transcriptional regulator with XRE-family HTH domain
MRNTTYHQRVAEEVRVQLARKSLTQEWLADATGIRSGTLSKRLRGAPPAFRLNELACIADALGVDVRDLLPPLDAAA